MTTIKELAKKVFEGDENAILMVKGLESTTKMSVQLEVDELKQQNGLMPEVKPKWTTDEVAEGLKRLNDELVAAERRKAELIREREEAEREQKIKAMRAWVGSGK